MTVQNDITTAIKKKKLVIGSRRTMKGIRRGTVKELIHSSPVPEFLKKEFDRVPESVAVKNFEGDAIRLGQVCGKPFKILALGIIK